TETICRDCRTLHVPAWSARAEWRFPGWLAFAHRAPQQSVERIFLTRSLGIATALREELFHGCTVIIRFIAKLLGGIDRRVNVWILLIINDIGSAIIQELLSHLDDFIDGFDSADVILRGHDSELFHIGAEELDLAFA